MEDATYNLTLSSAEALVLFDYLARGFKRNNYYGVIHSAEVFALWSVEGQLQKQLVEPFMPNYSELVDKARATLDEKGGKLEDSMPRSLDTTELSWPEVRDALEQGYETIVIAAGSIEQHGPHLPEMTDTLIGTALVREIVGRVPMSLQGPTISIGCSEHHMSFPGTVTLSRETFIAVVRDVARSLARHGFRTVVFIPSHGGNFGPLAEAVAGLSDDLAGVQVLAFTDLVGFVEVMNGVAAGFGVAPEIAGAHAGETETSIDLALRSDLVRMEQAEEGYVGPFNAEVSEKIFREGMPALTRNGILGDARPATAAHGEAYLAAQANYLAQWIEAQRG